MSVENRTLKSISTSVEAVFCSGTDVLGFAFHCPYHSCQIKYPAIKAYAIVSLSVFVYSVCRLWLIGNLSDDDSDAGGKYEFIFYQQILIV